MGSGSLLTLLAPGSMADSTFLLTIMETQHRAGRPARYGTGHGSHGFLSLGRELPKGGPNCGRSGMGLDGPPGPPGLREAAMSLHELGSMQSCPSVAVSWDSPSHS